MYSNKSNPATDFPLEFTGNANEFFKIWIVNIALSIITLGIYSAWAKVRTRRYLYSNTLLMNSPFDYLADPIKILKGRLIAFACLVIYSVSPSISPILQVSLIFLFLPFLPFVIIKALSFNAYNTAYHNIRFNFKGQYGRAFWVFLILSTVGIFSFGLLYPYYAHQRKKFVVNNMAYGTCPFEFKATEGNFYIIYLKALGIVFLLGIIITTLGQALMPIMDVDSITKKNPTAMFSVVIPVYLLVILMFSTYVYTSVTNLMINQTELAEYRFSCNLKFEKMLWIFFSNILVIIFSFGLMIPWAIIRLTRYRISSITVHISGDPQEFIAAEVTKVQAIGEEIGDIFDIDIGL